MARVRAFDMLDGELRLSASGNSARRTFQVSELSGDGRGRLAQAARAGGIPRVGEAHPALAGVTCQDVVARPTSDPAVALVEALYNVPTTSSTAQGAVEISLQSDLITEETIFDAFGQVMQTSYSFVIQSAAEQVLTVNTPSRSQRITLRRTHRVEVQRPTVTLVFQRSESVAPLAISREYAGAINSARFQGEPAGTWLCVVESQQDSATTHLVRYSFTLNKKGWDAQVFHQDEGVIPADISRSNGARNYQVYPALDFNRLGLPAA